MRSRRYIGIFVFILAFSEFIGIRLWAAEEAGGPRITGTYALLSLLASIILGAVLGKVLSGLFVRFSGLFKPGEPLEQKMGLNKVFFILWAALFICYIPCFLAFYPGIYNNDMVWQWAMYVMKNYNTHHPLIHTFLTGSLFEAGKKFFGSYNAGLAIHSVFQLFILSGSIAFAMRFLLKTGSSRRSFYFLLGFYALYPYIPIMGLSTTKDTLFGALFLIIFIFLCDMIRERRIASGIKLLLFFGALVLAGLFRNNAGYGFLVTAVCLAAWALGLKLRKKDGGFQARLALILGAGILVTQLCLALLTAAFHAEKGKLNEMLSVPCQQMARAYVYQGDSMSDGVKEELFRYIPKEDLENYCYYISDPVKNALNQEEVKADPAAFLKLWIKVGTEYPKEYIEAFLNNTFGIWFLTGDTGSNLPYEYLTFFDSVHVFTEESRLPGLKNVYKWFNYRNYQKYLPVVSVIFYTPFFCWMTLFGGFAVLEKKRYDLLILPLFLAGYIFTVALGPCVPVRYLFNIILCAPVLTAVVCNQGFLTSCKSKMS